MEMYGTAGQDTFEDIMWHMHFAYWITYATNMHSEFVILIAFPCQQ